MTLASKAARTPSWHGVRRSLQAVPVLLPGAALLFALVAAGGCASEVTRLVEDGAGGSTSSSTTSRPTSTSSTSTDSSTGGGPGCTGDHCCPTGLPDNETSCEGDQSCSYDAYGCATEDRTAVCVDGQWTVMSVASCEPLPADTPCDPYGIWRVVSSGDWDPPGMDWLLDYADSSYDITVALGASGGVLIEGEYSSIAPDGCSWSTGWVVDAASGDMDGEPWWTTTELEIDVTIDGDGGSGTMKVYCWGECGGETVSTATIERLSP